MSHQTTSTPNNEQCINVQLSITTVKNAMRKAVASCPSDDRAAIYNGVLTLINELRQDNSNVTNELYQLYWLAFSNAMNGDLDVQSN